MEAHLALSITALMAFAGGLALWSNGSPPAVAARSSRLAAAVGAFTDSLSPEQRTAARDGIALDALAPRHQRRAEEVIDALLGADGLAKFERAAGCRLADCAFAVAEHGERGARFALRARGGRTELQGAVGGLPSAGFSFCFRAGGPESVCALADEVTLARAFLLLLGDERCERARLARRAPGEVVLGPDRALGALGVRRGLPWQTLGAAERGVLWQLIERLAGRWHSEVAADGLRRLRAGGLDDLTICWAGSAARGAGLYLRLHGESFACELLTAPEAGGQVQASWRCGAD